jgi:NADH dehydrogenase FAD-containing subunit
MGQRVVVVGAGYGGTLVAKELDDLLEVVLIEPKDAFVHAAAALRAVVDPQWLDRVFVPYDQLLTRGRIVRDRVRLASPTRVHLSATESIDTDFLVLATGTAYPFPAKFLEDQVAVASARLVRTRTALSAARRVLLVGAGPVGLELAGELTSAFPDLAITIVEQEPDILGTGDYLPELRATVRDQLESRGVKLELGTRLGYLPPVDVGTFAPFTVQTTTGTDIEAQVWFRCYGTRPVTDYLDAELARARHEDGSLRVTSTLNVDGHDRVFAIGDITDVRETKRASAARAHAVVVAANIRALVEGRPACATYEPAPEMIVLPLGPDGGASQLADATGHRTLRGPAQTSALKGADLMSDTIAEVLGRRRARHA